MPSYSRARAHALLVTLGCASAGCRDAEPPATTRAFVSNEDAGTVSVIDTQRGVVLATIPVGKRPRGLRLSADRRTLYVALSGSPKAPPGVDESTLPPPDRAADGIGVVDLGAMRLVRTLASGQDPESFDLAGDTLVVSNEETGEAALVDVANGTVRAHVAVGGEPEGVTTAPDGTVWVTSEADGRVDVIDPKAERRIASIAVGARPRSIVFTRDGAKAYVANELGGTLSVIDVARRAVTGTIALPADGAVAPRPMGLSRSPDGEHVYVSTGRAGSVMQIATATDDVADVVRGVGPRPWGLAAAENGKVYAAAGPSNEVAVIDPEHGDVVARIAVGASPWGVVVDR
jgi:YVTN family beta-propeller protein